MDHRVRVRVGVMVRVRVGRILTFSGFESRMGSVGAELCGEGLLHQQHQGKVPHALQ